MSPRPYSLGTRAVAIEETRRRIVEAIAALHAEKGIRATRAEDIARRADVAVGTVYRHFPSLDDMVRACGSYLSSMTRPPGPEVLAGVEPGAPRVERLVRELFAFYERAGPWLEVGRCERAKVPALDAGMAHREAMLEAMVCEALSPWHADERAVPATIALTDLSVWKALSVRGLPSQAAADLVSEVLLSWLGRVPVAKVERDTGRPQPRDRERSGSS